MELVIVAATVVVVSFGVLWAARLLDRGRLAEVADRVRACVEQALRSGQWQLLAVLVAAAALFALTTSPALLLAALSFGVLVLFARAWSHEVLSLMGRPDADFPGRFDKAVWALFLLAAPPVGLWLLRAYRHAHWPEPVTAAAEDHAPAAYPDMA